MKVVKHIDEGLNGSQLEPSHFGRKSVLEAYDVIRMTEPEHDF